MSSGERLKPQAVRLVRSRNIVTTRLNAISKAALPGAKAGRPRPGFIGLNVGFNKAGSAGTDPPRDVVKEDRPIRRTFQWNSLDQDWQRADKQLDPAHVLIRELWAKVGDGMKG